jgi:hypothetical protein
MQIRTNGVPAWVTGVALFIGVFSVLAGIAIMIDPSIMDIDDTVVGRQWGGRNIGLGVALLVAVLLRDARAYVVAFAAGLFRDVGDLVASIDDGEPPIVPLIVLAVGIAAIAAVLRAGGLNADRVRPSEAVATPEPAATTK